MKRPKVLIPLILVLFLIIGSICCIHFIKNDETEYSLEDQRAKTYSQVNAGDEKVNGTEYVTFDAFYLRDIDKDGYADKIRGTCKEVGTEDTLYIDLNVLTNGTLKNAAIEINGKNFYFSTALVQDNVIAQNCVSNDTKVIPLNDITSGTQKLISGIVKSGDYSGSTYSYIAKAIGDDISKYSITDNSVTLTGTHVADDGTETPISKTVYFTNDWYGTAKVELNMLDYEKNQEYDIATVIDEDNRKLNLNFIANIKETDNKLIIKKSHIEGTLPLISGYEPTNVSVKNQNAVLTYDEATRHFVIENESTIDENGLVTSSISRNMKYEINLEYPLEAYEELGADSIIISIPIETYYEGYNNEWFENPYRSNIEKGIIGVVYQNPKGEVGLISSVKVGKYTSYKNENKYKVSKELPMNIYNQIENEEEKKDEYIVKWEFQTKGEIQKYSLKLKETPENRTDRFENASGEYTEIEKYVKNTGLYFENANALLGQDGYINVYDDDTNELLHTFFSNEWSNYNERNPYRYANGVKHIRIETSQINQDSSFFAYNIKEIDDMSLTSDYNEQEFNEFKKIYSYLTCYTVIDDQEVKLNSTTHFANYEMSYSQASLNVNPGYMSTQDTNKNVEMRISTNTKTFNTRKWTDGEYLIKYPEEVIEVNINEIIASNIKVKILNVDTYVEHGNIYTKIYTTSETEQQVDIVINADITVDPRVSLGTKDIELYYNNSNHNYYLESERKKDTYDLNGNGNTEEYVGYTKKTISLLSQPNLVSVQTVTDYDNKGSVTIAPKVASVSKIEEHGKAKINIYLLNNSSGTISEVKILGKVPKKGNTSIVTGNDLESKYDTEMEDGIKVPEELKPYATVYYSYNDDVTEDVELKKNKWTTEPEDYSKVKSYLIDLGEYVMGVNDTKILDYSVKVPNNIGYNEVTYSNYGVYYCLDTDEGKLKTQIQPNKVGLKIEDKFDIEILNKQLNSEILVQGTTISVQEKGEELAKSGVTNTNGIATIKDLCVEREYEIKEIKTNKNYVLEENKIRLIGHIKNGKLEIEILEGNLKEESVIEEQEGNNSKVKLVMENEVKYSFELTKTQLGTNEVIQGIMFELTDYSGKTKKYITNKEGKLLIKSLEPNAQYTLTEVKGKGHYLKDEITFIMVREDAELKFNLLEGNLDTLPQLDYTGEVPVVRAGLSNEKIPTYSLKIIKKEKDTENVLKGTKFKIIGEDKEEVYETNEEGIVQINNLYEYVEGKEIAGKYKIQETYPTEGYALKEEAVEFRVKRNTIGNLEFELISGEIRDEIGVDEENKEITITIDNLPLFTLTKVDEETKEPIEGVEFKVTDIEGNEVEDINGNKLDKLVTDKNGKVRLSLKEGLYNLIETRPADGYKNIESEAKFGIKENIRADKEFEFDWIKSYSAYNDIIRMDDGVIVAGDEEIAKYDFDGNIIWKNVIWGDYYYRITKIDDGIVVATNKNKLVKYDFDGKFIWENDQKTYTNSGLNSIETVIDGVISIGPQGQLVKYDFNGNILWEKQPKKYIGKKYSLVLEDGFIVVSRNLVIKYDFEGNIIWEDSNEKYSYIDVEKMDDGIILLDSDGGLVKYDFDGNFIWEKEHIPYYTPKRIMCLEDGIIVVTVANIIKYSLDGDEIWTTDAQSYYDLAEVYSAAVVVDDGIIIVGNLKSLVKYNFEGEVLRFNEISGYFYEDVIAVNNYFIAIGGTFYSENHIIVKYDSKGNEIWKIDNSMEENGTYTSIVALEDGFIVSRLADQVYIEKYDFNGNYQWSVSTGISGFYRMISVEDGIIATYEGTIVKHDLEGAVVWKNTEKSEPYNSIISLDDGIIGVTANGNLVKYDLDGEIVWDKNVDIDSPKSIIKLDDGIICVGGSGIIAKYDLFGDKIWSNTFGEMFSGGCLIDNEIVAISASGSILKYDLDGILLSKYDMSGLNINTNRMAISDEGIVVICDSYDLLKYKYNVIDPGIQEQIDIKLENKLKEYKITTEIDGFGGIISGQDEEVYEIVSHSKTNTKDIIVTPDKGFKVSSITVNGQNVPYVANDDGTVTLDKFESVTEDKHIVVKLDNNISTVIEHHYLKDTDNRITDDVVYYGKMGERYTTTPKTNLDKYRLVMVEGEYQIPENASGNFTEETQVVTYYYELKPLELIVHHYIDGTETSVVPDELSEGEQGQTYTTNPAEYPELDEKYELVEIKLPENANGTLEESVTIVTYYYRVKEHKITTEVEEIGGDITGKNENPYEVVLHGENSVKDIIAIPNAGYEIKKITINGVEQELPADTKAPYTLDKFTNMTEDKHIVVSFDVIKGNVSVYKVWKDNDNVASKRPESINIELYNKSELVANATLNEECEKANVTIPSTGEAVSNAWKYTYENVPMYDNSGNEINYRIVEKEVTTNDLYMYNEEIEKIDSNNFVVTNTFVVPEDKIEIEVTKTWVDNSNEYTRRPTEVKLQVKNGTEVVKEQVINVEEGGTQTYKFTDLAEYDEKGDVINYTVDEVEVNANDLKFYEKSVNNDTYTITNTFKVPEDKVEVDVTKVWEDNSNKNSKRPEQIKLQVRNGTEVAKEQVINVEEGDTQTYKFTDLAEYDEKGDVINYTVDEVEVNANDLKFYEKSVNNDTYTIINTFKVPEDKVEVDVTKVWEDNSNENSKRPEQIKLQVKNGDTVVQEEQVNAKDGNTQTHKFTNLVKYDEYGNEVVYTVDEAVVNENDLKFYEKIVNNNTNTITNTFRVPDEKINIDVTNKWEDNDNVNGIRPEKITLQVKNGEEITQEKEFDVTEENEKVYTFENLTKYDEHGDEIVYTIEEADVTGYDKEVNGTTVTNRIKSYKITTEVKGEGGDITGKKENPYEIVIHGRTSTKDITATPEQKYKITEISVNGESIEFTPNEDGTYTLDKFTNMTEDKHIVVSFEKKPTRVVIKYKDIDTDEEISTKDFTGGYVGDEYTTEPKEIDGYELVIEKIPVNIDGVLAEEEIEVIYYYRKIVDDTDTSDINVAMYLIIMAVSIYGIRRFVKSRV